MRNLFIFSFTKIKKEAGLIQLVTFVNDGEVSIYATSKTTGAVGVFRFNSDIPNEVSPDTDILVTNINLNKTSLKLKKGAAKNYTLYAKWIKK